MASREVDPTQVIADLPIYLELIEGHVIRLIELLPGEPDDDVAIRLHIHELEHAPKYEAISYVWGDATRRISILCNGKSFSITASLDAAFRRIRLYDCPRIVWADAICINQAKTAERNHHVAFMNLVYRRAETVLVCIGAATDTDAHNIKSLIKEHAARSSGFKSITDMPLLLSSDPILDDPRWTSVATLFQNQWFSRAWVLQEVGVASNPRVLYGNVTFSYRDLMRLARWIVRCASQIQQRAEIPLMTVHTDWVDWSENWKSSTEYPYTLVDFLSAAKGLECREMHDHVYAFIGHHLLQKPDGNGPIIKPEYQKPVIQVFQEFTSLVLPMAGSKLLSAIEHNDVTINESVPSWVVRWDMDIIWNSMGYYYPFYYRASGPETTVHSTSVKDNSYITDAVFLDVVQRAFPFSAESDDWPNGKALDALTRVAKLRSTLNAIRTHFSLEETPCRYAANQRSLALALTLGAGLRNYERAENNPRGYETNFDAFCELLDHSTSDTDPMVLQQPIDRASKADDFYFDLNLSCKGRSCFVTRTGFFGLGPLILRPGDECHIFRGARVPFTLREVDGKRYKLLGEAYVHGIMHGEFVTQTETGIGWRSTVLV